MLKRCSSTLTGCAVIGALLLAGLPGGAAFAQTPPSVNDDHERRLQRLERVLENQILLEMLDRMVAPLQAVDLIAMRFRDAAQRLQLRLQRHHFV